MTNIERGEIDLTIDSEGSKYHGRTFTLKLSMNAAVAVEQKTKKRIGQLYQEASALGFESIRYIVWALLQKHHGKEFKTEVEVGDLMVIRDCGAYAAVMGSNYLRRPLPPEVLVDGDAWRVTRRRQTLDDLLALED